MTPHDNNPRTNTRSNCEEGLLERCFFYSLDCGCSLLVGCGYALAGRLQPDVFGDIIRVVWEEVSAISADSHSLQLTLTDMTSDPCDECRLIIFLP